MEAAASSSSSTSRPITYDVFLTFSNKDIGKTFADHLHRALYDSGLNTFRHGEDASIGENIGFELQRAILESNISIVVFTKNDAYSSSCMDVLAKIVECRREMGHQVVPVFYDVSPSDVRKQARNVGKALADQEEEEKEERGRRKAKVEIWKAALREVADLAGKVLENQEDGHEARFIKKIVEDVEKILQKLKPTLLSVPPYLVGMESPIRDVDLWVKDGSTAVGVGVICGMFGIGKTTVAKMVYNSNIKRFEKSSFLGNVREASLQMKGLVRLQKQLLLETVGSSNERRFFDSDEGIIKIQEALCNKRILLVLDNVDHVEEQLNALIGSLDWFYPGSKIIITTRREQLLKGIRTFKIKKLDEDDSLRLFCWHAFGQDYPSKGFEKESRIAAGGRYGGIPMALKFLGSSLSGKGIEVWQNELEKSKAILPKKIRKTLEQDYDSLQDDHTKDVFIKIASSFVGKDEDFAVRALEEEGLYPKVGIQDLIDGGLIAIDHENKLVVEPWYQDMARAVIRKKSDGFTGKNAMEVVEGQQVTDMHMSEERKFSRHDSRDNNDDLRQSRQRNLLKQRLLILFRGFNKWFR